MQLFFSSKGVPSLFLPKNAWYSSLSNRYVLQNDTILSLDQGSLVTTPSQERLEKGTSFTTEITKIK